MLAQGELACDESSTRLSHEDPLGIWCDRYGDRPEAPAEAEFERAASWWQSLRSSTDARFDDVVEFDAADIEPTVTWGINPGQSVGVTERLPKLSDVAADEQAAITEALEFMDLQQSQSIQDVDIDVAFIGSCTNSRISDLREAANIVRGRQVADNVRTFVVPGSQQVLQQAVAEGLDQVFEDAGFDWRGAGCSMCLAMNPDKLRGREMCASSSNRNFKGRQGSPTGRTLLMSPAMVAAAAITGRVTDVRALVESTAD